MRKTYRQLLLPDDPQKRLLEQIVLSPNQFREEFRLQPYLIKYFTINLSKLIPPVNFRIFSKSTIKMYLSDIKENRQPTAKNCTFKIMDVMEFKYPRNYPPPTDIRRVQKLPNNTIITIGLEAEINAKVDCGLNQFDPHLMIGGNQNDQNDSKDSDGGDSDLDLSVKEILQIPNVKLPERMLKIKNKITDIVSYKKEALEYIAEAKGIRKNQLSKITKFDVVRLNKQQQGLNEQTIWRKSHQLKQHNLKTQMAEYRFQNILLEKRNKYQDSLKHQDHRKSLRAQIVHQVIRRQNQQSSVLLIVASATALKLLLRLQERLDIKRKALR